MKTRFATVLACSALAAAVIAQNSKPEKPADSVAPAKSASPAPATPKPATPAPAEADATKPAGPKPPAAHPADAPKPATTPAPKSAEAPKPTATPAAKTAEAPKPATTPAPKSAEAPKPKTPSGGETAAASPPALITSDLGGRDLLFLTSALDHGQTLVYLSDLAKSKAETEQVKAVGDVLSSTQVEENKMLARLATMKGITLSATEAATKKKLAAKLDKLTGPKLDKALMEEIIATSEKAVSTFEVAAQTKDADIKAFVDRGLPMAKEKLLIVNKVTGNAPRTDKTPGFRTSAPAPESPEPKPAQ